MEAKSFCLRTGDPEFPVIQVSDDFDLPMDKILVAYHQMCQSGTPAWCPPVSRDQTLSVAMLEREQ